MPPDSPQHYGYILSSSRAIGDAVPAFDHYALARPNNAAPFASGTPQPPGSNRTTQRLPKTKPDNRPLTKSISSPHLRAPIMSESELDKKRNKLGYQRISIACAHCRRRKIRCLLAADDPEQRCQNCIRLKKECVFYPVDQQAMLDARSEALGKSGPPSAPSSAVSTSPLQSGRRGFDHAFTGSYGDPAMPPISAAYQNMPIVPRSDQPVPGSYSPQDHSFQAPGQPAPPWATADFVEQHSRKTPVSRTPSAQPPFTRYAEAPAADVAPFPGPESPAHPSPSVPQVPCGYNMEQMQQQPHGWQSQSQVTRAVSYSDYPQSYNARYQQTPPPPLPSSYPHQPSMHPPIQQPMQQPVQPPGPGMTHMPQYMPPPGQHQYVMHHDPRSAGAPGMPSAPYQSVPQMQWYSAVPSHAPMNADPHRLPSHFPPGCYDNRPR